MIGEYEVLEVIGCGGMGVVYKARQACLDRLVALKVLPGGVFAREEAKKRFWREAQAVGQLRHGNIVPIYDLGEADGQPYYSMEYVEGRDLGQAIRDEPFEPSRAAKCLKAIAQAVQHAHSQGILHRDLKPSNILLSEGDTPKITDFGLALRSETTSDLTASGNVLGTPAYMAPEVAAHGPKAATTSADVYSLGAVLYEMITGRPPFMGDSALAVIDQVKAGNFATPRQVSPVLPRDLELVCLKCLRREPSQRYANAAELAADCDRFLRHEPVSAREVTTAERLLAWTRRHRLAAGLTVALVLSILLGMGIAMWQWSRAEHLLVLSQDTNRKLVSTLARSQQDWAEPVLASKQPLPGLRILARLLVQNPSNHLARVRLESAVVQQRVAWPALPPLKHKGTLVDGRFDPSGRWILTTTRDNQVHVWDCRNGEKVLSVPHRRGAGSLAIAPDGDYLATSPDEHSVQVWAINGQRAIQCWSNFASTVTALKFSPVTRRLAIAEQSGHIQIRAMPSGDLRWQGQAGDAVEVLCFDWQERRMLTAGPGHCSLWTLDSEERTPLAIPTREPVVFAEFSRDSLRLLTLSGGRVQVWDPGNERLLKDIKAGAPIQFARFDASGRLITTTSHVNRARVYDIESRNDAGRTLTHEQAVNTSRFGVEGQLLITTSDDGAARIWHADGNAEASQPIWHRMPVLDARFSYDDKQVLTICADNTARLWSRPVCWNSLVEWDVVAPLHAAAVSRDGRLLAVAEENRLRVLSPRHGRQSIREFAIPLTATHLQFSPSSGQLALADASGQVFLTDIGNDYDQAMKRLLPSSDLAGSSAVGLPEALSASVGTGALPQEQSEPVIALEFSENEQFFAAAVAGNLWVWATRRDTPHPLAALEHPGTGVFSFSPDSSRLACAQKSNVMRLYDTRSWQPVSPPLQHNGRVEKVAFSPVGDLLASAGRDCLFRIWSAADGRPVTEWLTVASRVTALSFSADSKFLLVATQDGSVRRWDAHSGREIGETLPHRGIVLAAVFSPDGRQIATLSQAEGARLWDTETGLRLTDAHYTRLPQTLRFIGDGRQLLVQSSWPGAEVWSLPIASSTPPDVLVAITELLTGDRITADGPDPLLTELDYRDRIKRVQSVFGPYGPESPFDSCRVGQPLPGTARTPNKLLRR
jgi:serine/threonine protein kinase/WD40 repeat protein